MEMVKDAYMCPPQTKQQKMQVNKFLFTFFISFVYIMQAVSFVYILIPFLHFYLPICLHFDNLFTFLHFCLHLTILFTC